VIFTFGFGHSCPRCGRSLANCYTEIESYGAVGPIKRMFDLFGQNWSIPYATKEDAGVERFGLKRIETNTDDPSRCLCGATITPRGDVTG
jgi:hypothetical protein